MTTEQQQPEEQQQTAPSPAFLEGQREGMVLRQIYELEEQEQQEDK